MGQESLRASRRAPQQGGAPENKVDLVWVDTSPIEFSKCHRGGCLGRRRLVKLYETRLPVVSRPS